MLEWISADLSQSYYHPHFTDKKTELRQSFTQVKWKIRWSQDWANIICLKIWPRNSLPLHSFFFWAKKGSFLTFTVGNLKAQIYSVFQRMVLERLQKSCHVPVFTSPGDFSSPQRAQHSRFLQSFLLQFDLKDSQPLRHSLTEHNPVSSLPLMPRKTRNSLSEWQVTSIIRDLQRPGDKEIGPFRLKPAIRRPTAQCSEKSQMSLWLGQGDEREGWRRWWSGGRGWHTGVTSGHFQVKGCREQCGPWATWPCEFHKKLEIQMSMWFGEGNGNPLQHSCLDNPMDREAWRATVRGVEKESDRT